MSEIRDTTPVLLSLTEDECRDALFALAEGPPTIADAVADAIGLILGGHCNPEGADRHSMACRRNQGNRCRFGPDAHDEIDRWCACCCHDGPDRETQLRTMPYREYLQTPEWQDRRRAALTRADRRCQVCNRSNRALHVHHRTYERRGAELETD